MTFLKSLFWNPFEHRLRTFWRILIFLAIAALLVNPVILLLDHFYESLLNQTLINCIMAAGFFTSLVIVAKYIDKCRLRDYGILFSFSSFRHFLKGSLIGGALITVVVVACWAFGLISIKSAFYVSPETSQVFLILLIGQFLRYLAGSIFEELFARAFLIKNITEGIRNKMLNSRYAVLITAVFTSALFGILHIFNPDFNLMASVNLFLLGLLFAIYYIYSGDLAWPIGLHFGWNVFQNLVFGFPNSGKVTEVSFLTFNLHQSEWFNGGSFGLEASLLSTLVLLLAITAFLLGVRKNNPDLIPMLSLFKPAQAQRRKQ